MCVVHSASADVVEEEAVAPTLASKAEEHAVVPTLVSKAEEQGVGTTLSSKAEEQGNAPEASSEESSEESSEVVEQDNLPAQSSLVEERAVVSSVVPANSTNARFSTVPGGLSQPKQEPKLEPKLEPKPPPKPPPKPQSNNNSKPSKAPKRYRWKKWHKRNDSILEFLVDICVDEHLCSDFDLDDSEFSDVIKAAALPDIFAQSIDVQMTSIHSQCSLCEIERDAGTNLRRRMESEEQPLRTSRQYRVAMGFSSKAGSIAEISTKIASSKTLVNYAVRGFDVSFDL
jgi:hypothetical protein